MSSSLTTQTVLDHYSSLAREDSTEHTAHIKKVAESFGYSASDLSNIPEGANLGLSCGNPLVVAGLKPGETVIDLGSGAGFDVFQAARRVGPSGLAIGVDISEDMLARARLNASKASIINVKFVLASITNMPIKYVSADCIISNCVINLLAHEDKKVCFGEVFRLLRPGGRLAVSDILAKKTFPDELKRDMGLYVGCISGASLLDEYEAWLKEVGFQDVMILDNKADLNIYKERGREEESSSCCKLSAEPDAQVEMSSCCAPSSLCGSTEPEAGSESRIREASKRVADINFNEWVSSYSIYAIKPDTAVGM